MKDFKKGDVVAYCPKDTDGNIYKVQIGIVKDVARDPEHVFVCYHAGETGASTHIKDLYQVDNGSYLQNFLEIWGGAKNEYKPVMTPPPAIPSKPQNINISITKTPHTCPICLGTGHVYLGYYNRVNTPYGVTSGGTEQCRSCQGKGVLWSE